MSRRQDNWQRLQVVLQDRIARRNANFGGGLPGGRGSATALGALIVLGLGGWAVSSALYNGEFMVALFMDYGLW